MFRRLLKIEKSDYQFYHICPSACLHRTARLPLDGFCWNLIFETFSKIFRENSSLIKMWQKLRVLYTTTFPHLWQYLAKFFLEWEISQIKFVEKIKTRILYSVTFFPRKSSLLSDNVDKYGAGRENTNDMAPARGILETQAYTRERNRQRSCTHTHLHTRGRTRARISMPSPTLAFTQTHTYTCNTFCFSTGTVVSWRCLTVSLHVHCPSC